MKKLFELKLTILQQRHDMVLSGNPASTIKEDYVKNLSKMIEQVDLLIEFGVHMTITPGIPFKENK